jgi:lysozyme
MIANPANATLALSPAGAALIQNDEDSRGPALVAFKPTPNDVWTIGWGHTQRVCEGMTCTAAQAQAWFLQDMAWAQATVLAAVTVPLNQNQFDALVSFTENEGATSFEESTLLRLLNTGNYGAAAAQFSRWVYQRGQILPGLVTRRNQEAALFNTPINT